MYAHILLPTDGSPGTAAATRQALSLATTYGASLSVLYVHDVSSLPVDAHARSALQQFEEYGRESVDAIVRDARDRDVPDVQGVVREGTPVRAILEYVDDGDCDLVVMGTHGRTGLTRRLLGSVTSRVLRESPVPVLAVPM